MPSFRAALNPTTGAQNGDRIIFAASASVTLGAEPAPDRARSITILGNNATGNKQQQFRSLFVGAFSEQHADSEVDPGISPSPTPRRRAGRAAAAALA